MHARRILTGVGAGLGLLAAAGCAATDYDGRDPWEVRVEASPAGDGLLHVRTYTVAPSECYAAGEIRSAPSTQAQSIQVQVQAVLTGTGGYCDAPGYTEVVHDLPGLRLEPDDDFIEVVVSADGIERNRVLVPISAVPPVAPGRGYAPYAT